MYNIFTKYKKFIFLLIKWGIVLIACYFIFQKISKSPGLTYNQLSEHLDNVWQTNIWILLGALLLTDANWLAEIYKWKLLATTIQKTSFMSAFEQCLAAMTVSIITPNRIGEYGAKVLYFEKENRKSAAVLALTGNLLQLLVTIIFGLLGGFIVLYSYEIQISQNQLNTFYVILLLVLLLYFLYRKFNLLNIRSTFKAIPGEIYSKVFSLSVLRYVFFSHQFYLLCVIFEVNIAYSVAMPLIFSMYLLASIIPALALFDWAIKGSIAVILFSLAGINELVILSITTIMWVLNFGIPALLGAAFVINKSNISSP